MGIVGLVIQQHDGTILFQNVREYLTPDKAQQCAKAFRRQIVNYDESKQTISTNHLSGSIVVLNMYRIHYMILTEIFILAISQANDNPYEGTNYLARAKRVLQTVSKDLTVAQVSKKYTEIYFALERVLFGEDGVEVLQQRSLTEIQPHIVSGQSTNQGQNIISNISTPFMSSGIQIIPIPVNVSGKFIDLGNGNCNLISSSSSSSNSNICSTTLSSFDSQTASQSFVGINKLDGVLIPSKIFTVEASLPKLDKHVYDPPQTIKWGTNLVPPVTTNTAPRVSNRIMFTLRHPNANNNRERENSGGPQPSFSSSPVDNVPTSPDQSKDIIGTLEMDNNISKDNNFNIDNSDISLDNSKIDDDFPKRKFSLSMGTFKNIQNGGSGNTPQVPDIRSSKDSIDSNTSNNDLVPSPTPSTKTKINFLQF